MPFRESPRVIYRQNPLVEVICQLRFPTILRIGTPHIADFQDNIRGKYPRYEVQEPSVDFPHVAKEVSSILLQIGLPKPPGAIDTYRFSAKDSQRFVTLSQDFLALTECKYEKWEMFREAMNETEGAFRQTFNPAFYTRIGLRYKDIIVRSRLGLANEPWKNLLQPHIVAELADQDVSDAILTTQKQSIIKTLDIPDGQVKLTHGLLHDAKSNEQCYLIDADFSVANEREGFNEPFAVLDKFNHLAGRLFRWAITDKLHAAMEPERI